MMEALFQYLLDPQIRTQFGNLLVALALGDLFQHERHARFNGCCICVALPIGQGISNGI